MKEEATAPPPPWWITAGQLRHFRFALVPSLASASVVMALAVFQADLVVAATGVGQAIVNSFGDRSSSGPVVAGSALTRPLISLLTMEGSVAGLAGTMVLLLLLAEGLAIFSAQRRSAIALTFRQRLQKQLLAGLTRATGRERRGWEPGYMHLAVCQDASGIGAVLVFGLLGTVETFIRISGYVWGLVHLPGGTRAATVIIACAVTVNWLVFRGFLRVEQAATSKNQEAIVRQHTRSLGVFQVLSRLTQLRGEAPFVEQLLHDSRVAGEANRAFQLITTLRSSLSGFLAQISLPLVALLLISSPGAKAALDPGKLAQSQALAMMILANVAALLSFPSMFIQYGPVITRLLAILQVPQPGPEPPQLRPLLACSEPLPLRVDNLRFAYPDSERVLFEKLRFEIPAGALVGIVGESGSGKSSLARVLCGEYPAQTGTIRAGDVDITAWHPSWRRHLLGVVPSDAGFLKDTLRVNLEWGRPAPDAEKLRRVLRNCRLERAWEQCADTVLESAEEHLSSGERRRVGVARLLLGDQPLWIFDEPLANLDPRTMREVAGAIETAARGRTVLVITHDPDMLATDFNLFLGDGAVLDHGSHAELMDRNPRYRDLVDRHQAQRSEPIPASLSPAAATASSAKMVS
jgi:ABC-type multidrug transport system fused ATPase/permease subunit